ncbi:hypothetical protein PVAP13_9KG512600 [Panicum virgatum]|uniref:Uncharacterized protein n=1 Tax=Panicum virgatum TaxID=38727 RepID=A0A8T0NWI3_PANVG|nr:hypothetical protein PVAP13_9KG512600 [Panicum virgatum]
MLTKIFCLVVIQNFKTNSLIFIWGTKYISCAVPSVVLMLHYAAPYLCFSVQYTEMYLPVLLRLLHAMFLV